MALTYKGFINKNTGQKVYIPNGRYGNFLNSIKKMVNYVRYNIPRYYVAHVILTVAENVPEVDSRNLHRVTQFILQRLKRADSDFKYIAVKEIQERGAIHYHILCVYSRPYVFPSSAEIAASWGLGFVKVTAPRVRIAVNKIAQYIGKYIGKGYEYEALEGRKSFTASQIRQIYKLKADRLEQVMKKFGRDVSECFKCTYTKVYGGFKGVPDYKYLVMEFESDWELITEYDRGWFRPAVFNEPF
jgi:hypothetical protein